MTERALVIYIGEGSERNFPRGLDVQTWGFTNDQPQYADLQPGDWVVFGVRAAGAVRVPAERWATSALAQVMVGRLTRSLLI
jgi:hypothetical protein